MNTMKTTLLLFFMSALMYGQFDKNLTKAKQKPEKEKTVYNNDILRHKGKNDIGGVLNIGYQTSEQAIAKIKEKAKKEMWETEKEKESISTYDEYAKGGIIHLYLTRLTIDAANTEWFTVIVKDSSDSNEILRKELRSDIPNRPSSGSDYWWNYATIYLNDKVDENFFIYVIDELKSDNNKFKFEVKL